MQTSTLPTLQQKIQSSRKIWHSYQNDKFIDTLYKILDTPSYHGIISWTADGSQVEIKDQDKLETQILPLFQNCPNLFIFKQRLEDCSFIEDFNVNRRPGSCYFEHLTYTRDYRPSHFNDRLDSKKKSTGCNVPRNTQNCPPVGILEWHTTTRKRVHKENSNNEERGHKKSTLKIAEKQWSAEMNSDFFTLITLIAAVKAAREENLRLQSALFSSIFRRASRI